MHVSVRIRLARAGAKKKPFYRVVVADQRAPRDGRFIEIVGRYNPRTEPSLVELDLDRINEWLDKGAQPTETVTKLIAIAGSPEAAAPETEKDKRISKKQQAKAAAESDEAEAGAAEDTAAGAGEAPEEESSGDAEAEDATEAPAAEMEAADEDDGDDAGAGEGDAEDSGSDDESGE
jgi:small subunit ribosomal protein S16